MSKILTSHIPSQPVPVVPIYDFITKDFPKYGKRKALINGLAGESITYEELSKQTETCAASLWQLGVTSRTVVSFFGANSVENIVGILACLRLGTSVTLANHMYVTAEFRNHLEDSHAQFAIVSQQNVEKAIHAASGNNRFKHIIVIGKEPGCVSFSSLVDPNRKLSSPPIPTIDPRVDVAMMPYSSGTTGLQKGVLLTHFNLVACLMIFAHPEVGWVAQNRHDFASIYPPLAHISGFAIAFLNLCNGNTLLVFDHFDFEEQLKAIEKYKISLLLLLPAVAVLFSKSPVVDKYDLSSIEVVISGAAPVSKQTEVLVLSKLKPGVLVRQLYGMTETSAVSTSILGDKVKLGSIGRVHMNAMLRVIDLEDGKDLGPNKRGEILAKGPFVFKGYFNKPQDTAATIDRDGWVHTGDIGYYDEEEYFFIVDRKKELIKYKGYQVAPAELEAVILSHPGVNDVGVIGVPDLGADELPRAYVVLKPDVQLTEQDIAEFVKGNVAPYKYLRGGVEFVREIPKSASGKILRKDLRAHLQKSKL